MFRHGGQSNSSPIQVEGVVDGVPIPVSATISGGNAAAGPTGSAVPASADYQGVNVGGTLRGVTGVNPSGSVFAEQVDIASIGGNAVTTTIPVSGTITATGPLTDTQLRASAVPVSLASAPSTSVTQGTSPWVVGQSTAANLNATVVGTGTFAVQASQATAANLNATVVGTGTFATQSTLQTGSNQIGHLEPNQSVNLAQVAGATISQTNPVPTVFPGTLVSGTITSAMSGTTSTSLVSGTGSNFLYITSVTVSNASTTVSTDILLQDGSGGTTLYVIPCPAATVATTGGGGATVTFPVPLKVPTSGNALYCQNVTTGSSTKASACGFRSTVSY